MFGYFFFAIREKCCAILSLLCSTTATKSRPRASQVADPSSGHHPLQRDYKGDREGIPHIHPIPQVIRLELFLTPQISRGIRQQPIT